MRKRTANEKARFLSYFILILKSISILIDLN